MVHGHGQHVLVRPGAQQGDAQQRPGGDVERLAERFGDRRLQAGAVRHGAAQVGFGQVGFGQADAQLRVDNLYRLAVTRLERGAQRLVPPDDLVDGAQQHRPVERSPDVHGRGNDVAGVVRPELLEEPHPLLHHRDREDRAGLVPASVSFCRRSLSYRARFSGDRAARRSSSSVICRLPAQCGARFLVGQLVDLRQQFGREVPGTGRPARICRSGPSGPAPSAVPSGRAPMICSASRCTDAPSSRTDSGNVTLSWRSTSFLSSTAISESRPRSISG